MKMGDLRQLLRDFIHKRLYTNEITILMCFLLACTIEIPLVRTQDESSPSVLIIETDQTVKEGESLSFTCLVSNHVAGGMFMWTHRHDAKEETSLYDTDTSDPRITVTMGSDTLSHLMVTHLSSDDSGLISCRYSYTLDGNSILVNANRSVCVASQPELPPFCLEESGGSETVSLICNAEIQCPEDITLRWFDVDVGSMEELIGDVTESTDTIEIRIITSRPDQLARNYLCKLESRLYPNVSLNCSNEQLPKMPDVISTIGSLSSTSSNAMPTTESSRSISSSPTTTNIFDATSASMGLIMTSSSDTPKVTDTISTKQSATIFSTEMSERIISTVTLVTNPDKNHESITFSQMLVIIAACAGGVCMLIVIVIVILFYTVCKRACKNNSDSRFQVKFERNITKKQPENSGTDQDNSNDHYITEEKENQQESAVGKVYIPIYAKPDKTKHIVEGSSNSAFETETSLNEHEVTAYASLRETVDASEGHENPTGTEQTQKYSTVNEVDNARQNPVSENTEVSQDSNLYASVQDSKDTDVDRPKMELPEHESVNEYAYAYTELKKIDPESHMTNASCDSGVKNEEIVDGPHYFVLEKENQDDLNHMDNTSVLDELNKNDIIELETEETKEIDNELDENVPMPPQRYTSLSTDEKLTVSNSAKG